MFQPELRRALEKLGSTKFNTVLPSFLKNEKDIDSQSAIKEIIESINDLSDQRLAHCWFLKEI